MEIRIVARNFDLTSELKKMIRSRVQSFKKYFDKIIDVHVMLNVEKYRNIAEISTSVMGTQLVTKDVSDDMYISINRAADKMERRLRKYEEKIKEHKGIPQEQLEERVREFYKLEDMGEEQPG